MVLLSLHEIKKKLGRTSLNEQSLCSIYERYRVKNILNFASFVIQKLFLYYNDNDRLITRMPFIYLLLLLLFSASPLRRTS